jgi:hypothetical protein
MKCYFFDNTRIVHTARYFLMKNSRRLGPWVGDVKKLNFDVIKNL